MYAEFKGVEEITNCIQNEKRDTWKAPTWIYLFACTLNESHMNSLRNIRIILGLCVHLWFSKAWFNAQHKICISLHFCLINVRIMNYSNHLLGHQNYRLLGFPINMSHFHILEASCFHRGWRFFTFLEIWQHHILEWLPSLLSLLSGSHIETIFISTIKGWWVCK